MKIVTPYRPFAPESTHHQRLGPFDWPGAIRMLRESAARHSRCDTFVITDVDTPDVPGPAHFLVTTQRRLMLWILDVSLQFLRSPHFDQDTVMVSPDILVVGDLRPFFTDDIGLIVRTSAKFASKPDKQLLNSVQWWPIRAQETLVHVYERALAIAQQLPENRIVWGADTDPLIELIAPVRAGRQVRGDIAYYGHEIHTAMVALTARDQATLDRGAIPPWPAAALVDFKYGRKRYMQRYFNAVMGEAVRA